MWCTSDSIWLKIWHYDMSQKWQVKKLSKLRKNFKFSGKKFRNFLPIRSIFLLQAYWKLHGLKNWNKSMEIRMQRVHMLLWNSKICENLRKITKIGQKGFFDEIAKFQPQEKNEHSNIKNRNGRYTDGPTDGLIMMNPNKYFREKIGQFRDYFRSKIESFDWKM